jgi:hypothetical protein
MCGTPHGRLASVAMRYSRPVKALIATGIAASSIVMAGLPAAADTVRNGEWWMTALGVRDAWSVSRGAGITVAVLSDGVDAQQPDVTGPRLTIGPDFTGTGQSSGPYYGEIGTGIAALIGGHGYGLQGTLGILGEVPSAQVLSVRVTLPPNDPLLTQTAVAARLPDAIAQGIRYAVSKGATVIDLPLDPSQAGVNGHAGATAAAGGSAAEKSAVKYALSHKVVLVAPAGDDNTTGDAPNFPAAYPGVIAVGAFNKDFVKAPWSSHQSYVTVTAAGSGLMLPTNSGTFSSQSSTVYASAVVAGIVAMIQGRFPGITVAEVRKALIAGAMFRHAGGLADGSGYGAVNAQQSLTAAETELTSAASLAGAGTQPLASQPTPKPASNQQKMTSSIVRDAVISVVLLAILLLLVALYAATGRRRATRQREAVAAGWSNSAQRRNSRAGSTDADRMVEFFAAPVAGRAVARPGAAPVPPRAASGAFPAASGPTAISRDPFGPIPALAPGAARDAADSRSAVGPASRAVTRRPSVSGAPPWEDASRPEGDLPWAADPGSPAGPGPAGPGPAATPSAPAAGATAATAGAGVPSRGMPAFRRSPTSDIDSADAAAMPGSLQDLPSRSAQSGPQPAFSGPTPARPGQFIPFAPAPDGPARPLSPTGSGLWDRPAEQPPADTYGPAASQPDFSLPDFSQTDFSQTAPPQPSFGPPTFGEPSFAQPTFGDPGSTQPTFGDPGSSQPGFGRSGSTQPTFGEPSSARPSFAQPTFGDPGATLPTFGDPGATLPAFGDPGATLPAFGDPSSARPSFAQPTFGEPNFGSTAPSQPTFSQTAPSQPSFSRTPPSQSGFSPLSPAEPTFSQTAPSRPEPEPDFPEAPSAPAASAEAIGSTDEPPSGQLATGPWRGLGRPGQGLTGRLDWGQQPASDQPSDNLPSRHRATDDSGSTGSPPRIPGGPLPVRQPRQSAPGAANSPSGSLWERAVEPAEPQAEDADAGSRPAFGWNPGGTDGADSAQADLAAEAPKWRLRHRPEQRDRS